MIGLALIFIFILIFFYQKYIHKKYLNLEEENKNKISTKLLYIFLIFLPFFDISIAYIKTGLDILTADNIVLTDAGKKFKEDKEELEYLYYNNIPNYIKKGNFYYTILISENAKYYINFTCSNINDKDKEEINFIENEMKNTYKNLKVFKNSFKKIGDKYYNSCTKELLFYNPYNKISNSVSFNTILFPLNALYHPSYYISFIDYTFEDYLFGNEYFNIKYFVIPYSMFVLFVFIYCLKNLKYIKKTIYITISLIFLPYIMPGTIEFIKEYSINIKELKKDIIYESKYKEDLIKESNNIKYINRILTKHYLLGKKEKNKNMLYEKFEKKFIKKGNYMAEYIYFRDFNSDNIVLEKFNNIYKKNYSVESLFGLYEIYKK